MTRDEVEKMCRQMGIKPEDFEKFKRERAAGAAGSMTLAGRPAAAMQPTSLEQALDRDRLCKAMGIKPEDFAKWQLGQLQLALDRWRRGEPLTGAQEALVAAAATAAPAPTITSASASVTPPAAAPSAPTGRAGRMRLDTFGETR